MKRWFAFILFSLMALVGCSADYDTFGTSPYKVLKGVSFEEQDGDVSVYTDEHVLQVTTVEPPESLSTWDSLTIETLELSHLATLHLVDGKFKEFPSDSAALDSLAKEVSYVSKKLQAGDKIRVPKSLQVYLMVVAENGDPSIWQLQIAIPGVEVESSSSSDDEEDPGDEENPGDENSEGESSSSSEEGSGEGESSSSEEAPAVSSSSVEIALNGNTKLAIIFKNQIENNESGDSIFVTFPRGTDLTMVEVDTVLFHRKSKIDVDPKSIDDWSEPQKFVVTAENDSTRTWWVIPRKILSGKNELTLNFENKFGEPVLLGDTLHVKLQNGLTVETAKLASFAISDGAKVDPKPDTVSSWADNTKITVTAENGSKKTFIVTFSFAEADEKISDEKELVSISAKGEVEDPTVDVDEKTVVIHLPSQEAMGSVEVSIEVSEFATYSFSNSETDWRREQTLTIIAQDSSLSVWKVSADYPLSSEAELVSFNVDGIPVDVPPTIDASKRQVDFGVPFGTDLSEVCFDAVYSDKAEKESPSGDCFDLSKGSADIVVKAEDGSTKTWKVVVTVGPEPEPEPESSSNAEPETSASSPTKAAPPRITSMKIAGNNAVVDSIQENGKWVHWVHYDNLTFLADLTKLTVSDIKLSDGASISGVTAGSSYDLGMGVKVTVSNADGEKLDYEIRAGYQYPNSSFNSWDGNVATEWANGNTAGFNMTTPTSDKSGAKLTSLNAKILGIGQFASGNIFTGFFNPKGIGAIKMMGYGDGNELIDFGRPFKARPRYVEFDVKYEGEKDSCDIYVLIENRTLKTNDGKNQNRTSTDVNTLIASAWYRSTTDDSKDDPDVVSVTSASRSGYKTIRMKLKYGVPDPKSPIYNSKALDPKMTESGGIDNHLVTTESPEKFAATHIRIALASSSLGNVYKGSVGATLYVDEVRLIY